MVRYRVSRDLERPGDRAALRAQGGELLVNPDEDRVKHILRIGPMAHALVDEPLQSTVEGDQALRIGPSAGLGDRDSPSSVSRTYTSHGRPPGSFTQNLS